MITQIAAIKVQTNEIITMIEAINRFSANIFFSCFIGPTKKHVLCGETVRTLTLDLILV